MPDAAGPTTRRRLGLHRAMDQLEFKMTASVAGYPITISFRTSWVLKLLQCFSISIDFTN